MSDNITLPREVVEQLLKMLEMVEPYADQLTDYSSTAAEWPLNLLPEKVGVAITALRTHLAAEQPKPEPVAWRPRLSPNLCFHWSRPWSPGVPSEQTVDYWNQKGAGVEYAYAAPPALAAEPTKPSDDVEALRRDAERLKAVALQAQDAAIYLAKQNERLREALKLALNSHNRMLMSDPPQDAWKFNRVDEVIAAALRREETT